VHNFLRKESITPFRYIFIAIAILIKYSYIALKTFKELGLFNLKISYVEPN